METILEGLFQTLLSGTYFNLIYYRTKIMPKWLIYKKNLTNFLVREFVCQDTNDAWYILLSPFHQGGKVLRSTMTIDYCTSSVVIVEP